MIKPPRLRPGDTVAAVSLSWGGPAACPARYAAGKRQCEEELGLRVVEARHALRDADWIAQNPRARADDLMEALIDPAIGGVISTIGGDDSLRILPYLDLDVIRAHPKVLMGYSDTTVTHFACFAAGVTSFYGPSFMSGFAENGGMHRYLVDSVRRTIFESTPAGEVRPNHEGWTVERLEWADPANQSVRRRLQPPSGWRWLQGSGRVRGPLIGGCADVLEFLKGTAVWPRPEQWDGAILFYETSEEQPPPRDVRRWLRNLGAQGILQRLSGILLGRPGGHELRVEDHVAYDEALTGAVRDELGLTSLPLVTGMDFGHTEPFFVLPYGITAELDCDARRLSIVESAVV